MPRRSTIDPQNLQIQAQPWQRGAASPLTSEPRRAVRMLQEVVGVAVDGLLGPLTLRAALAAAPEVVIDRLAGARRAFYDGLVQRDPSQERFLAGWQNRVRATTGAALKTLR